MAEYQNALLDEWVGGTVLVKQLSAIEPDEAFFDKVVGDPALYQTEPLRSRTGVYRLESYDRVGVTVTLLPGEDPSPEPPTFVPWGTVISINVVETRAERTEREIEEEG